MTNDITKSKIRILDLINTDRSARELLDRRIQLVNATGRYHNMIYCSYGEYVEVLRQQGHTVFVVDTPRGLSPIPIIKAIWRTFRLLRKKNIHIIHTHGSVIGVIGRLGAFFARTPVSIHQVHGFHHHDNMKPFNKWIFIQIEKLMTLFTDKLFFQNMADIEECRRRHIAPEHKITFIGNGIDLEKFDRRISPQNVTPVIICTSRFEPVKNHPLLLQAAEILHQRQVKFELQLIGDGLLKSDYEDWVRRRNLNGCVKFLGYRDDVPMLTRHADIAVLVSQKEGLPRAIIEASAAGVPVIATDVIGNRDALIEGHTGFLVPLNNPEVLADKLELLINDKDLQQQFGRRARIYARENFDERAVTERIINMYDQYVEDELNR